MDNAVRQAGPDDVEAIRAVGLGTWPTTYAFAGEDYVADGLARWWSEDVLRRVMSVTHSLVAERGGAVVGMSTLDLRPEVPAIWKLYVLPAHQGCGVGKALLDASIAAVPTGPSGRRAVAIEWLDGNDRAAAFYAARGFVETRRESDDVRADWPDTVWAEKPLA